MANEKKTSRKKFRVAVSGSTVDGREISPVHLREAAENFNPDVYAARVNVEHYLSPCPSSEFSAMGDVTALSTEDITEGPLAGRTALYAEIEPTERMKQLVADGKKIYSSIELHPQFSVNVVDLKNRKYQCEQVNYDTFISYPQLDAWAAHPDFQSRVSTQIARQVALDRIMIGFNGTSHADESNFSTNKLLQDVNVGWLEHIRTDASERVMNDVTLTSRNMDNTVAHAGKYANADALVQDARSSLLDEWHKEADDLVVIMGRNLFNSLRLPVLNSISGQNPNAELLAGQLILSSRAIGGLDVFLAPFFPDATMLITSFNNLSIYWQKGTMRRLMKDEPEYNRIATYQSINDAYVVEDYGKCAMVTGLKFADS